MRVASTWTILLCGVLAASQDEPPGFTPRSMAYVLQADRLARTRADAVEKLAGCGRDLVVIDYSHSGGGDGKWTREDIFRIRAGGTGRRVVAYLSIGEAEDYRDYWKREWDRDKDGKPDPGSPKFLNGENPDWEGNYKVRYWHPGWQKIILSYLDEILAQGFDGIYLDIVDAYEFYEYDPARKDWIDDRPNSETENTYRRDMIAWVKKIAGHARKKRPGFLVIPQNGSPLLAHGDYLETIDAIAAEDLFTNGKKKRKEKASAYRLGYLERAKAKKKPVLLVEYGKKSGVRDWSIRQAKKHGLVLLLTDRDLKTLGQAAH